MTKTETRPKKKRPVNPDDVAFGKWVSAMLTANEMTQSGLAREIDCSRAHVSRIVSGTHSGMSDDVVVRIAKAFQVAPDVAFHAARRIPPEISRILKTSPASIYGQIRSLNGVPSK